VTEENPFSDIEFRAVRSGRNQFMPNQDGRMSHWECTIGGGKDAVTVPVSLSVDDFGDRPPTLQETLGFLAADAASVANTPDIDAWFATMNAPDDHFDRYAETYHRIAEMAELMSRRFGPGWAAGFAISASSSPVPPPSPSA
jgi:hypothetical protein